MKAGKIRRSATSYVGYNDVEKLGYMVKFHIMEIIDLSGYDVVSSGNVARDLHRIFKSEYSWNIKYYGGNLERSFIEWCKGLPSSFNILYWNGDIEEKLKEWGVVYDVELIEEEGILMDIYLELLYSNLFDMM